MTGVRTLIFDLSEVFISGLLGVERGLGPRLGVPAASIMPALSGEGLQRLFRGEISEADYLRTVIEREEWRIGRDELAIAIRQNFHWRIPGTAAIARSLASRYELAILSDHAAEWIDYVHRIHPWLELFARRIYSYELRATKKEVVAFQRALAVLGRKPAECCFVDDKPANVERAAKAGVPGFTFSSASSLRQDLAAAGILT